MTAWDLPRSIYRLASSAPRSFRVKARCGECRRSWSNCGRRSCCTGRRRRCLRAERIHASRAWLGRITGRIRPLVELAGAAVPRLRSTTGSSRRITPLPLLENHFGVLSLEGFGLAGRTAAAAAAGAILYYVRSTQRGSLDHVDRIGWYERQNCLVLDAVTVRNLELIEPLFAGSRCGPHVISLDRFRGYADGQAPAAGVAAAAVPRSGRDSAAARRGGSGGEGHRSRAKNCGARSMACSIWSGC